MTNRYDVLTWDCDTESFTPQEGMAAPCSGVPLAGVLKALRELRRDFGYSAHRCRTGDGRYESDASVLVERIA